MFLRSRFFVCLSLASGALLSFLLISPQDACAQVFKRGCMTVPKGVPNASLQYQSTEASTVEMSSFLKDRRCVKIRRTSGAYCDPCDEIYPTVQYCPNDNPVVSAERPVNYCNPIKWGYNRSYHQPAVQKRDWHYGLTNEEVRAKTIWSGADSSDRKMQAEVLEKQLRDSPEAPETIRQVWTTAQYFLASQKPVLAEPLLKELVATIESHKITSENRGILAQAKYKLSKLEAIKNRIKDRPNDWQHERNDARTGIVTRYRKSVGIGMLQY